MPRHPSLCHQPRLLALRYLVSCTNRCIDSKQLLCSHNTAIPHIQLFSLPSLFTTIMKGESSKLPANYLQPAPVRGQLEPPNQRSAPGWRYIQCTDTPNQFRVRTVFLVQARLVVVCVTDLFYRCFYRLVQPSIMSNFCEQKCTNSRNNPTFLGSASWRYAISRTA